MPKALIVGAGIGGLAAGVALQRAGWHVRIRERASSPRELGFALALAPNAMAALEELGLSRTVAAAGVGAAKFDVCRTDGRIMRSFGAPPGAVGVIALRSALHGALLNSVGLESLALASEAIGFMQGEREVTLHLRDGGRETGDILLGADGVNSVVRKSLHPGEAPPLPSGFFAIRGLARGPAPRLDHLSGVGYLGDGIEAAAVRASDDSIYWYLSLLAADIAPWPREPRQIVNRVARTFDPRFRAIVEATDDSDLRLDELFERPPLQAWGTGRVTLLGDAAHPVLPHTGQGAALALEDAVALGIVLAADGDVVPRLRAYEQVRADRTKRLMALGPRIARMTTTHSVIRKAVRTAALRLIPEFMVIIAARPRDPHRSLRKRWSSSL
jgi:2-polyprenyl-6-methoxyphenol hydroxylase-like FAD-dependent oxidoreductase